MSSRRKRKRDRPKAEATVESPKALGGWGNGLPTSLSDLVLLRRAINDGWPVPAMVRAAIMSELENEIQSTDRRRMLSVAKTLLVMERATASVEKSE